MCSVIVVVSNISLLTLEALSKIVADDIQNLLSLFLQENNICHFMWIVCSAEDSYEMQELLSLKNQNVVCFSCD